MINLLNPRALEETYRFGYHADYHYGIYKVPTAHEQAYLPISKMEVASKDCIGRSHHHDSLQLYVDIATR